MSADQGRHWTTTALAASTTTVYLQPMVAANDRSQVAVSIFAVRQSRVEVLLLTTGPDTGPSRRQVISSRPFDASLAESDGGEYHLGDHQGLAATGDAFHPIWNDTRTGRMELLSATLTDRRPVSATVSCVQRAM